MHINVVENSTTMLLFDKFMFDRFTTNVTLDELARTTFEHCANVIGQREFNFDRSEMKK